VLAEESDVLEERLASGNFEDLGHVDATQGLYYDWVAAAVHTMIAMGEISFDLHEHWVLEILNQRIHIVGFSVLYEVGKHGFDLFNVKTARPAEPEEVVVIELAEGVQVVLCDPVANFVEHTCLVGGKVPLVSSEGVLIGRFCLDKLHLGSVLILIRNQPGSSLLHLSLIRG